MNLTHELYLAPEMMYASLDLAGLVVEATKDLPSHLLKDCFSNILVQGGNTDLQGFPARLSCDLREALPEQVKILVLFLYLQSDPKFIQLLPGCHHKCEALSDGQPQLEHCNGGKYGQSAS